MLRENWEGEGLPPIELASEEHALSHLRKAPAPLFGELCAYYEEGERLHFIVYRDSISHLDVEERHLYVAGDFNGWGKAIGNDYWRLQRARACGRDCYRADFPLHEVCKGEVQKFKFVTADSQWLEVDTLAPNACVEADGIVNYELHTRRTGRHCFLFNAGDPYAISSQYAVLWNDNGASQEEPILPGLFFYQLGTDLPLGARVEGGRTIFRLFAPRARHVSVEYWRDLKKEPTYVTMKRAEATTWEAVVREDLHGAYYYFIVDGLAQKSTRFDPEMRLLDPYALACVSEKGPGIVWDHRKLPSLPVKPFEPPSWQDLVIMETHVRDLLRHAPLKLKEEERLGFSGLAKWVRSKGNYLETMGVNCVELQPVQQFDSPCREDYHWGYMTTNYFCPCAWYGRRPEKGTQIEEFADLVAAFHEGGIAVVLDVVYNHVGVPPFLEFIDKEYYLDIDKNGELVNWSGCGNTTRASAAMMLDLIIKSLTHLVEVYDVDGFRFDLGELLGVSALVEIERALKAVKPGVILIVEPWSFRGHIARDLKHTGLAFWNDGFRDFLVDYVKGQGNAEGIRYYMAGSLGHLTSFPAQSVNYVESHDDFCWIDRITEQSNHDGRNPTHHDRARSHLMVAILMSSLGIPMLSAGQDYLRSKHGHHNTYLMGDVNALDYKAIERQRDTHDYFRGWIALRQSLLGKLFRLFERPSEQFFRFFGTHDLSAVVTLYNADFRLGPQRLLFAVNPHADATAKIHTDEHHAQNWCCVADTWRVNPEGLHNEFFQGHQMVLPPLSCALWVERQP